MHIEESNNKIIFLFTSGTVRTLGVVVVVLIYSKASSTLNNRLVLAGY